MSDLKALLERAERAVSVVPLPADGLNELQRRRDRRRRNQRLSAGVVGMAVFVASVGIVWGVASLDRSETSIGPGDMGAGSDPLISVHAQLTDDAPARSLFEVETSDPQYWRLLTLEEFDGEEWGSSDPDGSEGQTVTVPTVLPQPPGQSFPADTPPAEQFTFRLLTDFYNAHPLPLAQTPVQINGGDLGDVRWDPSRGQAFVDGGLDAGQEYTVRSRIVVPTAEELDQVQDLAPVQYGRWTELPDDLDPRFGQIAQEWTVDAVSDYDKVMAIQQHFHADEFRYDTSVEVADDADALLTFLTQTKTGFCQQYAATMAVLVRELGLPARIAVGYQAGTLQDDGSYLVQTKNAHAWVEVFFEGYGWLPFEPTPGHGSHPNAERGTYLNP